MALTAEEALAIAGSYTDSSIAGTTGPLAGKNCKVAAITDITGGHRVTFQWTDDGGQSKTSTMDVMTGDKGVKGDKGDTGNTGATGAKGDAATITIGSVTSGVSPSVTNTGTSTDAVLNFVLAKGDKGDKGDKGNDGADGKSFEIKSRFSTEADLLAAYPDGPDNPSDAYFVGTTSSPDLYTWLSDDHEWHNNGPIAGVKGDKGDQGDEGFSPVASVTKSNGVATITIRDKTGTTTEQISDGEDGQDGKSAYEVAVDDGFVGTESEWLASLKGDDGVAGANGQNGTDGVSPVANVTQVANGVKIHIEDAIGQSEETLIHGYIPVGMIAPFGGSTAPEGWLLCHGQAVSRTTYASLFGVIGTSFGSGDGSTTFNLPDLRDRAVMGVASDGTLGEVQDSQNKAHTHTWSNTHTHGVTESAHSHNMLMGNSLTAYLATVTTGGIMVGTSTEGYSTQAAKTNVSVNGATISGTTSSNGGTDARPKNVRVNYIIRYTA